MKLGSANTNDLVVEGEDIAPLHTRININGDTLIIESVENNKTYINETLLEGKKSVNLDDVIRIGNKEFKIVDPKSLTAKPASSNKEKPLASAEATVFRQAAVAPGAAEASTQEASGWMLQGMHKSLRNKRYPIDGTMTLGRSQECDLHFSYDRLSRKHAELKVIDGVLILRDLDSSNGCYHNGEKIKTAKIHPGDTISFDKLEFTVIGPTSSAGGEQHALNQTVVRSAITPDMLKQASKPNKTPSKKPAATDEVKEKASMNNALMITAGVVVVALAAAMFLL